MLNKSFLKVSLLGAFTLLILSSCSVAPSQGEQGAPVISKQPADIISCVSEVEPLTEILFSVEATGSNLSYEWFVTDGENDYSLSEAIELLAGKDEKVLVRSQNDKLDIYYARGIDGKLDLSVYAVVSNGSGSATSELAKFNTLNCSEEFSVSLSDQTVTAGDPVTFEAEVTGSINVSYEWFYFNLKTASWILVDGSSESSISIPEALLAMNGLTIKVIAYNMDDEASPVEATATLTVKEAATFQVDLPDVSGIEAGNLATLKSQVSNAVGKVTFEWFINTSEFQKIEGAIDSLYTTGAILGDTKFRVCATDDVLKQTVCDSAMVYIKVIKPFGVSLNSAFAIVGANAKFSGFVENGTAPYTYEWYEKDGSGEFVLLAGETALTLDLGIVEIEDNARQFRFCATDAKATKLCADAGLTVEVPEFKVTLNDYTTSPGNKVDFKAEVKYGTAPFTYEWYRNGSLLEGKTDFILTLDSVTAEDNGAIFKVCVTDSSAAPFTLCDEAFLYVIVK